MVFSIIIIVLLGLIAFFHYVQGFFSSAISAMLVVLSAVIAVSYDETVVNLLLKGKMADQAHSIVLCAIFGVMYMVLRTIFDAAIPGAVHIPNTIDKAGAVLMGLVAGVFATGIFAIAVQMLPFGPELSLLGYGRYALHDNPKNPAVTVPVAGNSPYKDSSIYNEMDDASLDPDKEKGLWIPVDDIVLSTVYHLSDGGSLAGDRSLASIHPDYLQELFGQRLGIQVGARRSALYTPGGSSVEVVKVFGATSFPARDGQMTELRPTGYKSKNDVKPGPDQKLLVIRIKVAGNATDDADQIFRFSTGSIHLVGPAAQDGVFKDYYPVGTLENQNTVLLNKPDDFLFVSADHAFDAVFVVDNSVLTSGKPFNIIRPGTFISIKRFANLDLSGESVVEPITADPTVQMIRHKVLEERLKLPPPSATPAPTAAKTVAVAPVTPRCRSRQPRCCRTGNTGCANRHRVAVTPTPGKDISDTLTVAPNIGFLVTGSVAVGTTSADPEGQNVPVSGGWHHEPQGRPDSTGTGRPHRLAQHSQPGCAGGQPVLCPNRSHHHPGHHSSV